MKEGQGTSGRIAIALVTLLSVCALAALRVPLRLPAAPVLQLPLAMPTGPAVELWLSTQDRRLRLARQPDIPISVSPATGAADIVIDTSRTFQSIVGFGAAMTDSSAWLIRNRLNSWQRMAFLRELFGPPPGLNLNLLRVTIGASDFSLQPYTLDDLPAGQVDAGLAHFNLAANLEYLIPTLREVLAVNPELRLIATPWSAPAWMKNNGSLIGGTLLAQY